MERRLFAVVLLITLFTVNVNGQSLSAKGMNQVATKAYSEPMSDAGIFFFFTNLNIGTTNSGSCEGTLVLKGANTGTTFTICGTSGNLIIVNQTSELIANQILYIADTVVDVDYKPTKSSDEYGLLYWSDSCTKRSASNCNTAICTLCTSGLDNNVCWGTTVAVSQGSYGVVISQQGTCPVGTLQNVVSVSDTFTPGDSTVTSPSSATPSVHLSAIIIGIISIGAVAVASLGFVAYKTIMKQRRSLRRSKDLRLLSGNESSMTTHL